MLTADCGNSSYGYLDICDQLLNGSTSPVASAPTASVTEPTVAVPPAAVSPAVATSPVEGVSTARSVYLPSCVTKYAAMNFHCTALACLSAFACSHGRPSWMSVDGSDSV